jgi:hypothetical protein
MGEACCLRAPRRQRPSLRAYTLLVPRSGQASSFHRTRPRGSSLADSHVARRCGWETSIRALRAQRSPPR